MSTHAFDNPKTSPQAPSRTIFMVGIVTALTIAAIGGLFLRFGSGGKRRPATDSLAMSNPDGSDNSDDNSDDDPAWADEIASGRTSPDRAPTAADQSAFKLSDIPFDGEAAYTYLKQLCALGSRTSNTDGMRKQQELLTAHFKKLGATTELQAFQTRHPIDGSRVPMANLVVTWYPDRRERILLCAHYDTRPMADRETDPAKQRGVFLGANDGASGTALLMQLGTMMPKLGPQLSNKIGVDFVFFDGEELVFLDGGEDVGEYFLGAEWFSRQYKQKSAGHRYRCGVLLDMVADAELHLYQDRLSMRYRAARPVVLDVWKVAKDLGVKEFIHARGHEITDDHLKLNEIGGIPTIDIIDFDYPRPGGQGGGSYWHTLDDKPENCSALSLAKVGWVVTEWMKRLK